MPSKNIIKIDVPDSYYHVYARGHSRSKIFLDDQDYGYFLSLFKRYLSNKPQQSKQGIWYAHLKNKVELLCYCMMENHFHLMLYQKDEGAMEQLMRGVMTSYSRYFNLKYNRTGALFESRYKATLIDKQNYLEHISRYIHLNRKPWQKSKYSSINYYLAGNRAEWLNTKRVLELFNNKKEYAEFVADYQAHKNMLDELKYELANNIIP